MHERSACLHSKMYAYRFEIFWLNIPLILLMFGLFMRGMLFKWKGLPEE